MTARRGYAIAGAALTRCSLCRYYHGRISRDEAVDILTKEGVDGSYLLRMSETQDGVYTISVVQGMAVRHIRVINTPGW